jgi:hypothetical protein
MHINQLNCYPGCIAAFSPVRMLSHSEMLWHITVKVEALDCGYLP